MCIRDSSLKEALLRCERWLVAEQHLEEIQSLDMAAENHEADRERHGEQETDRPPQPRPKNGRDDERYRRNPRAVPQDEGLHHLTHDRLGDEIESDREYKGGPARVHSGCEEQWKSGSDERAHIGTNRISMATMPHTMGLGTPI